MLTERLNSAVCGIAPSGIRAFAQLAAETPGCISLTLGEPDFDTPLPIRDAAKLSLDLGETHYIENNGTYALRMAISGFERTHDGLEYRPEEIIVTAGATEALFTALFGILEPGDEVVVPTPAFGLYRSIIELCRARFVPLPTEESGFQFGLAALKRAVTPKTKAILLNSPNNPTGCVYTPETLQAVYEIVKDREIFVVCDDVYRQLVYGEEYHTFAEISDLRDRILVAQSFSKPYAMTGWRVGYLMGDLPVIRQLSKVHQAAVVSAASLSQRACMQALQWDPAPMRASYQHRRELAMREIGAMGLPLTPPQGAFYLFPSIREFGMSSDTFCRRMIREAGLAATPGSCFDAEGHIRLTYCYDDEHLREGLARMAGFVRKLREEGTR